MPEGPELRSSRDNLSSLLIGKKIVDMWPTTNGRYKSEPPSGYKEIKESMPLCIESIDVKGKFMWWTLSSSTKTWYMWCTYGMSGQWTSIHDKHTAFIVEYNTSGSKFTRDQQFMYFVDPRHFGTIKFVDDIKAHQKKLSSLGPDVLSDTQMTSEIFAKSLLEKPNRIISEALMDQSCISGVGNYMRAEALWLAKVNPWTKVIDLTSEKLLALYESVHSVAHNSYKSGGATIHTYKGVEGEQGAYSSRFVVYGRTTDADGNPVSREEGPGGRTIHWSPARQSDETLA